MKSKNDPRDLRWWDFDSYEREGSVVTLVFRRGAITRRVRLGLSDFLKAIERGRSTEDWRIKVATDTRKRLGNV